MRYVQTQNGLFAYNHADARQRELAGRLRVMPTPEGLRPATPERATDVGEVAHGPV